MLGRLLLATPVSLLAFVFPSSTAPGQETTVEGAAAAPEIEILSCSVTKKPTMKDVPFFNNEGIEVKLAVRLPGKPLLAVDDEACAITSWADDQGTDLSTGAPTGFFHWADMESRFGDMPMELCILTLKTKTLPAKGSSSIAFDGTVAFRSAKDLTTDSAELKLEKGATFQVAGMDIELSSVEAEDWGDTQMQLEFTSKQDFDAIDSLRFLNEEGEEIESESMGSSSMGFGGEVTYTQNWGLKELAAKVTIEAKYYATIESIEVPLKFDIGPGL